MANQFHNAPGGPMTNTELMSLRARLLHIADDHSGAVAADLRMAAEAAGQLATLRAAVSTVADELGADLPAPMLASAAFCASLKLRRAIAEADQPFADITAREEANA
jgi:hypothetical protein